MDSEKLRKCYKKLYDEKFNDQTKTDDTKVKFVTLIFLKFDEQILVIARTTEDANLITMKKTVMTKMSVSKFPRPQNRSTAWVAFDHYFATPP